MSRQRRKGLRFNVSDGGGALDSLFIALGSDCIFFCFGYIPLAGIELG